MEHPRMVASATDLKPEERYCTCCAKPILKRLAYLELDQRTNHYHDFGDVPSDKSQGWFPFGMTCARKEIAAARKNLEAQPQ